MNLKYWGKKFIIVQTPGILGLETPKNSKPLLHWEKTYKLDLVCFTYKDHLTFLFGIWFTTEMTIIVFQNLGPFILFKT